MGVGVSRLCGVLVARVWNRSRRKDDIPKALGKSAFWFHAPQTLLIHITSPTTIKSPHSGHQQRILHLDSLAIFFFWLMEYSKPLTRSLWLPI